MLGLKSIIYASNAKPKMLLLFAATIFVLNATSRPKNVVHGIMRLTEKKYWQRRESMEEHSEKIAPTMDFVTSVASRTIHSIKHVLLVALERMHSAEPAIMQKGLFHLNNGANMGNAFNVLQVMQ